MATMPKCSGPTFWTRGTSWPLGLSKTKVLRALACLGFRDRDMGNSFRVRGSFILNPKGRKGEEKRVFFLVNPHTTVLRAGRPAGRPPAMPISNGSNGGRTGAAGAGRDDDNR